MTRKEIRTRCLSKAGATEELPFDDETFVYKIGGKMFALISADGEALTLKCDPERSLELRAAYEAVQPGWHMNKKHWITVSLGGDAPTGEVLSWIDGSYDLVAAKLPKAKRPDAKTATVALPQKERPQ